MISNGYNTEITVLIRNLYFVYQYINQSVIGRQNILRLSINGGKLNKDKKYKTSELSWFNKTTWIGINRFKSQVNATIKNSNYYLKAENKKINEIIQIIQNHPYTYQIYLNKNMLIIPNIKFFINNNNSTSLNKNNKNISTNLFSIRGKNTSLNSISVNSEEALFGAKGIGKTSYSFTDALFKQISFKARILTFNEFANSYQFAKTTSNLYKNAGTKKILSKNSLLKSRTYQISNINYSNTTKSLITKESNEYLTQINSFNTPSDKINIPRINIFPHSFIIYNGIICNPEAMYKNILNFKNNKILYSFIIVFTVLYLPYISFSVGPLIFPYKIYKIFEKKERVEPRQITKKRKYYPQKQTKKSQSGISREETKVYGSAAAIPSRPTQVGTSTTSEMPKEGETEEVIEANIILKQMNTEFCVASERIRALNDVSEIKIEVQNYIKKIVHARENINRLKWGRISEADKTMKIDELFVLRNAIITAGTNRETFLLSRATSEQGERGLEDNSQDTSVRESNTEIQISSVQFNKDITPLPISVHHYSEMQHPSIQIINPDNMVRNTSKLAINESWCKAQRLEIIDEILELKECNTLDEINKLVNLIFDKIKVFREKIKIWKNELDDIQKNYADMMIVQLSDLTNNEAHKSSLELNSTTISENEISRNILECSSECEHESAEYSIKNKEEEINLLINGLVEIDNANGVHAESSKIIKRIKELETFICNSEEIGEMYKSERLHYLSYELKNNFKILRASAFEFFKE